MKTRDFTTMFLVDQTPAEAFAGITNVRGWWSGNIEGGTTKVGDVFTFSYKDVHRSTQKLTEVVPDQRVVWRVLDANLSFTDDKAEWKGTEIRFEIAQKGDKTEVRFTHVGLVPEVECFDACSSGWTFYIRDSLQKLITTGKGAPAPKERKVSSAADADA